MPYKFLDRKTFLIQVQRDGRRLTRRGTGNETDARRLEAELLAELMQEQKLDDAARTLGIDRAQNHVRRTPTLKEFFSDRWVTHARVVQNEGTQRTSRVPFNYLLYYCGESRLDELLRPAAVNAFVEQMKENGPVSFFLRRDGQPRKRKCEEFTNATINKSLQCLKALLNLAYAEQVIKVPPQVDLLPQDDSKPVLPPTEEEFQALVASCKKFHEVAPLLAEVVEFTSETGLRRGEVFNLAWRSVDLGRGTIRVEMQQRGRLVNGTAWRPKHNKWREVPLSARARAIIEGQRAAAGSAATADLVFPNRGGCPYVRIERAPATSGIGYFDLAIADAGLKGSVTFHSLRHLFAVRLLTRGVPITVVSELLGHSDINLTVKRYGRFASDAKVKWDAVKVLDGSASTMEGDE